ncbi:hypothetical protein QBC39DRAFT_143026 [Podospora conica]|nr:hypothetical protein QBC39DRAFT_143026 [Schizothecium conicum]
MVLCRLVSVRSQQRSYRRTVDSFKFFRDSGSRNAVLEIPGCLVPCYSLLNRPTHLPLRKPSHLVVSVESLDLEPLSPLIIAVTPSTVRQSPQNNHENAQIVLNKSKESPECLSKRHRRCRIYKNKAPVISTVTRRDSCFVYPCPARPFPSQLPGHIQKPIIVVPAPRVLSSPSPLLLSSPLLCLCHPNFPDSERKLCLGLHGLELAIGTGKQEREEAKPSAKAQRGNHQ